MKSWMIHQFIEVISRSMGPYHFALSRTERHRHEEAILHFSFDLPEPSSLFFEDQLDLGHFCIDFRIWKSHDSS